MSKLLQNVFLIDGERYTKESSVSGILMEGIGFYLSYDEQTMAVVNNKDGRVIAEIGLKASGAEGGGGSLYVIQEGD